MMNEKKHGIGHNIRQAVLVTVVLLVLCGLVFPVLLSGLSAVIFPSQAKGSLVTADGIAVGAKNVGQDFTEDYFMWGAVPPRTITILTMKRTPTATARWSSTTTTVLNSPA